MGAWACQRAVRWDDYLMIRTLHDGLAGFDPVELYDVVEDPHQTTDLARERPGVTREGLAMLEQWSDERLLESATGENGGNPESPRSVTDPFFEVMAEGGPYHGKAEEHLPEYADRLRETGRAEHAERLEVYRGIVPQDVHGYLEGEDVWAARLQSE